MEEYKGLVTYWITFNEINILKIFADGNKSMTQEDRQRVFEETHHQFIAAAKVVKMAHEIDGHYQVGSMIAGQCTYPYTCNPTDIIEAQGNECKIISITLRCHDQRGLSFFFASRLWKEKVLI